MITESFDPHSPAIISPEQTISAGARSLARGFHLHSFILFFSRQLLDLLAERGEIEPLHPELTIGSAAGKAPIFRVKGADVGVALSGIGAPAAAAVLEGLAVLFPVERFIMFGSSGALGPLPPGALILPAAAVRDEGTSYHYSPASEEIPIPGCASLAGILDELGIPYVSGKTWTTDAFYRETEGNRQRRIEQGCVCVEMECSALQAVCDFRGLAFYPFLYSADSLHGTWDRRILGNLEKDSRLTYFALAREIALRLQS